MKDAPIPAVLTLWSLGHSASNIAERLGFPNHKHVTRIIEHARSIRDPRAVLHAASNGRLIGRPGRMKTLPPSVVVPAIGKPFCVNGHARTPENVTSQHQCRACKRIQYAAYDKKRRAK